MRYVEIDGMRVDVIDCERCPLLYCDENCLHPAIQSTIVDFDWDVGIFPCMCPLREADE